MALTDVTIRNAKPREKVYKLADMALSLDAKKYFVNTTLHVRNAAGTEVLQTEHKIAPWVVSAGVAYRF